MNTFTLRLLGANRGDTLADIASFIGEDSSGSFGLQAGHARFIAVLTPGLARFRRAHQPWQYLAAPGAVVYFADNVLTFGSRRYFLGDDARAISLSLQQQLQEERELHVAIENLRHMERDMLKRLWELNRGRPLDQGVFQ